MLLYVTDNIALYHIKSLGKACHNESKPNYLKACHYVRTTLIKMCEFKHKSVLLIKINNNKSNIKKTKSFKQKRSWKGSTFL